jgi:antitoxin (DNA-binding transcriptional repressor) of toxin-antitoxin stability system
MGSAVAVTKEERLQITYEQFITDSNHYLWRVEHGEAFDVVKDGKVVVEIVSVQNRGRQAAWRNA